MRLCQVIQARRNFAAALCSVLCFGIPLYHIHGAKRYKDVDEGVKQPRNLSGCLAFFCFFSQFGR